MAFFARAGMQLATQEKGQPGECVAALVYVYDHAAREGFTPPGWLRVPAGNGVFGCGERCR